MTSKEDMKQWTIDLPALMEYEKILRPYITEKTTKIIFETYDYPFLDEPCCIEFEPSTPVKEMLVQFLSALDLAIDKKFGSGGKEQVKGTCYDRITFKDTHENYKYVYIGNRYT